MSDVRIDGDQVRVTFTRAERLAGLVRDLRVPRTAVAEARLVPEPLAAVRGLRAPGLALPGRRRVGTWRSSGRRQLVCVRRGEPALLVRLRGQRYDSLLIGTPNAERLARELAPAS